MEAALRLAFFLHGEGRLYKHGGRTLLRLFSSSEKGEEDRPRAAYPENIAGGKTTSPDDMPEHYDLQAEKPETVTKGGHTSGEAGAPLPGRAFPEIIVRDPLRGVNDALMLRLALSGQGAYLIVCAGKLGKAPPATSLPETTAVRAYKTAASAGHFREQRMTDDLVKLKEQPGCCLPAREGSAGEASHPDTVEGATESASTPCDEYVFPVIFPTKNGKAFIRSVGGLYRSSPARCTTPS